MTDSISVLYVEDDSKLAEIVESLLERADDRITVRRAVDPDDALDALGTHDVDCIVSDYDMPRMSGIEFLEAVRADHPELPFILYTGKGSEQVASEAISAGVTDYLQKEGGTSQYAVLANRIANAVEQYRSKRALEENRKRLSLFFEESPLGVIEWDESFDVTRTNEAAEEILGYSEAELLGNSWETIVPDADPDGVATVVDGLLAGEGGFHSINENVRKDGEQIVCEWHNRVVTDENGDVVTIFSQFHDITERRNQQEELKRHRAVVQAASNTIITLDESNVVQSVNPAVEETFGYTPEELIGERVTALMSDAVADRHRRAFERYLETGERTLDWEQTELEGQHRDGTPIPLSVTFGEITYEGERLFVGILRDSTERKAREEELRRKERRYQAVFNDPNILVGLIDTDGAVLEVNETARAYIDRPVENLKGERVWETAWFDRSETLQEDVKEWVERAAAGEYVEFEAELARSAGGSFTVKGVFRPVTDEDGAVVSVLISGRDVTDRKGRERELELFRTLLDHSTDSVLVVDPETAQFLDVNETACDRRGYSRAEMLDRSVMDFVTEIPDLATWQSYVDDLKSNREMTFDGTTRRKDGSTYPVEVNATYLELDREYVVAIARDVSEKRAYHRELEWTNAVLSTLLETLPVGVLAEDEERNVLVANRRLFDLFEFPGSPDDVVGADCERLAEQVSEMVTDSPAFVDRINELVDGNVPVAREALALEDGRQFERSHDPVDLPDGAGHIWVYRDVTEQKLYEARLEGLNEMAQELMTAETRERVAEIGVEAARDVLNLDASAIHLVDDGRTRLVPVAKTETISDLIGEIPAFTEGNSIAWRAYENDEAFAIDDVHEDPDIYNPDSPVRSELFLPLGEYGILIAGSLEPNTFDQEDLVLGNILVGSIVTALEQIDRTEQLRSQKRALRRQNDRLEEFASIVSHDLRNPLNVAEGRIELARQESDSEHLEAVDRAHERMNTLIDDLLTLAREGTDVTEMEPVAFDDIVWNCWEHVATAEADLVVETDRLVRVDRSRIKQLFENLMRNAIEHGGADVTVRIGELPDGFFVEDDGPGISGATREELFDLGYSTSDDGTGFGLAIVEQIAEAHGWSIDLREREGGGARFEITGVSFASD